MIRILYLISIYCLLSFFACNHNKAIEDFELKSIKFANTQDSFKITDTFNKISCIQLEMTEESILGKINKISVTKNELIVLASNEITVFDKNTGKYLRHIGSVGEGPEEYLRAKDICHDRGKDEIVVYDKSKNEFLSFNLNGSFKKRIKAERRLTWMASFEQSSDGTMLVCNMLDSGIPTCFTAIFNDNSSMDIDPYSPITVEDYVAAWAAKPMSAYKDELKFVKIFSDTIFSINENTIRPLYKLEFDKKLPLKETIAQLGPFPGEPDYMEFCTENDLLTGIDKMFETSGFIVLIPQVFQTEGYYWIDKTTGTGFHIDSTSLLDIETRKVSEGKTIINITGASANELISCFDPCVAAESFKEGFKKNKNNIALPPDVVKTIENIDPEGNPFLIIYEH